MTTPTRTTATGRVATVASAIIDTIATGYADAMTRRYVDNGDGTVTWAVNGIVRTVGFDHPVAAVIRHNAACGFDTTDTVVRSTGTGRGHTREFVPTDDRYRTATGSFRSFMCHGITWPNATVTPCTDDRAVPANVDPITDARRRRIVADAFPTVHGVRSDGTFRNVAECRSCRDRRTAANRGMARDDARRAPAPAGRPVTIDGTPIGWTPGDGDAA